ncbi:hypothetical protein C2869_02905 [Saccharobesus litoralis]|uniref:DUF4437 domain-containing protein n=1 Tax=Saccharobesus litoralis TaxID=2172099 RepID=A0A2S0VMK0_9ALTE|nr:DUF4437 domain-containing protein [Saccharobesus litoralis]AWB65447.1 hypothetical protein C2869_02905 [Saccharobesus litoralis]
MQKISRLLAITTTSFCLLFNTVAQAKSSQVITTEQVDWGYLNPLRGDKSPAAADLWGDRTQNTATGMLVKFKKGFASPPHIHNISYRGVVIKGLMHNADPHAGKMWMGPGSYWTQPAGHDHITAANSVENLIYLEIDSGPYLVKPSNHAFDNGEKPVNVDHSNLVWLDAQDIKFLPSNGAQVASLWQSKSSSKLTGSLIKLQAGFNGTLTVNANEFKAVVISGAINYASEETKTPLKLNTASFFSSTGRFAHQVKTKQETLIYVRSDGLFNLE